MIWWIQLLLGAAILISGFLIVRNRSRPAKWQAGIKREYGGWGAEKAASRVTPATMVIIGLGWMFGGNFFLVNAVVRASQ
jgi:hypothetical protein